MDKIGIIGATGFIGSNLVQYLNEEKQIQTLALSRSQLQSSQEIENFLNSVSSVVYLAHEGGPNQLVPLEEDIRRNILPLENFLSRLKTHSKRIVYLSSGGTIYGNSKTKRPWSETDSLQPLSTYAKTKVIAEKTLMDFFSEGSVVVLRPSNPYGNSFTHSKPQGVIDVILNSLLNGTDFTLYDAKETVRDYIHLSDLNEAIFLACTRKMNLKFEVFNVGTGIGTSLQEVIHKIENISGLNLKLTEKQPDVRMSQILWSVLDPNKIRNELGWTPKVSLDVGLKNLIEKKGLK